MDENSNERESEVGSLSGERLCEFTQAILDVWQNAFADILPEFVPPALIGLAVGVEEQHDICQCDECDASCDEIIDYVASTIGSRFVPLN